MGRFLLSALTILLVPAYVFSQSKSVSTGLVANDRDSLRNIGKFGVVVEQINFEVEHYGLSRDQIQADVELRLRKIGIQILSSDDTLFAYLYVNVGLCKSSNEDVYAFDVDVEFKQPVTLLKDNKMFFGATTWSKSIIGIINTKNLTKIREAVADLTDQFLNDYLAANPKK